MNHHRNASISKLLLAALAAGAIIVAVIMLRPTTVSVIPDPPRSPAAGAVKMDATTSHLSVALNFPKAVITAELEGAIPKTFKFDESRDGARAYGSPSRAPLNVAIDPAAKRISASTSVGGRVQVEKRVKIRVLFVNIDELASVGIDVSGSVGASASPLIGKDWVINPGLFTTITWSRKKHCVMSGVS
ncbi:MAG: hypothetical protein HY290_06410 [Planctomycetia bacterium]|nr:hypothetical protein [Planctomycetia bacterium]